MKNEFKSTWDRHSEMMEKEFRTFWVKAIVIWMINITFSIAVLCGIAYLITRIVMFAISQ
jgi:hypothetical protein